MEVPPAAQPAGRRTTKRPPPSCANAVTSPAAARARRRERARPSPAPRRARASLPALPRTPGSKMLSSSSCSTPGPSSSTVISISLLLRSTPRVTLPEAYWQAFSTRGCTMRWATSDSTPTSTLATGNARPARCPSRGQGRRRRRPSRAAQLSRRRCRAPAPYLDAAQLPVCRSCASWSGHCSAPSAGPPGSRRVLVRAVRRALTRCRP